MAAAADAPSAVRAASPLTASLRPATRMSTAAQGPLADGEWRVSWCASCVGSMAVAADGVWYGTIDGLAYLDAATGEVTSFGVPEWRLDGWSTFPFNASVAEPPGAVWGLLKSRDSGPTVARFDGSSWRTFTAADGLPDADPAYGMALDATGGVWVVTHGGGAARFDGTAWTRYGTANGLPSDDVRDVAVAPDGTVWLATRSGLAAYDGASWRAVTAADGLPALGALAVDVGPDGALWVGLWDSFQAEHAWLPGLARWTGGIGPS